MFGGGIAALGILAGWGWLRLELEARGVAAKVVVQDVRTHYRRPLHGGSLARCLPPEPGDLERFLRTLDRKGRARLSLQVEIRPDAPEEGAAGANAPRESGVGDPGRVAGVAAVTEARFVAIDPT
jgi:thioesterase domain-containing protein